MTAAQRTEPGTDVAPRRAIGELPPEIQQAIELRKARNLVAAQIAGLSWGEKIDDNTRRAVAGWGQQFGVDVTTEIHILGGRVYLNAAFYIRQLSYMIAAGLVEYAVADHVEDDPRLKLLGAEGEGEFTRRLRERIMHSVPDNAKSATVFRVKLKGLDREITGTKWCGTGRLNQYNKLADPVGEEFPVETSESRAARRAVRLIATHVPKDVGDVVGRIEQSAEALSARVAEGRAQVKEREALGRVEPKAIAAPADPADPYSVSATREREAVREPVRDVPAPVATAAAAAPAPAQQSVEQPALALDAAPSRPDPAPAPAPAVGAKRAAAAAARMPFSFGQATVGTPLNLVVMKDLAEAREWAMRNSADKFAEFIEASGIELDDRRFAEREGAA